MIDTNKYEETNWDLRGQFTHTEMADEVLLLLAEVKRLREVAYRKDMQVGERDREVKRLRETLATIKEDIDGYVSGKGWDGNIEGWQCISDSIAALGIESESEEE